MPDWFYEMPSVLALLAIYVICCSISLIGYGLSIRFFRKFDTYEVISKIVWQTILFFSSLFITFWIAINWHNLKDLSQITKQESHTLESLYEYTDIPESPEYTKQLHQAIIKYIDSVINTAFPLLAAGEVNLIPSVEYRDLLKLANGYKTNNTLTNEFAYNRLMHNIELLIHDRSTRLGYAMGELNGPLLGFFLAMICIGSFWTGAIFSRNFLFSLLIIMSQNIVMASSTWLVLEIDKPFQGYFKVNSQAYIDAKIEILGLTNNK
jgi:NADH:ubiquinone oxidoreductase subunit K